MVVSISTEGTLSRRRAIAHVVGWVVAAIILVACGLSLGSHTVVPGPWSREALERNPGERAALSHGIPPREEVLLLVGAAAGENFDSVAKRASIDHLVQVLREVKNPTGGGRLFERISTVGHSLFEEADEVFLSHDATTILIRARSAVPVYEASAVAPVWQESLDRFRREHPTLSLQTLSYGGGDREIFDLIHRDLDRSLFYTLPITAAILWWVFGSGIAAAIPLVVACLALAASLGGTSILSHYVGPISATAHQLVVLFVLALGVDYSLFLVSRVREEYRSGRRFEDALVAARRTTGRAIVWSGVTVGVSLMGLFLMNDAVLTSMALVSIVAVGVVVATTLDALPAILSLIPARLIVGGSASAGGVEREPVWRTIVIQYAVRHSWIAVLSTVSFLLLLCYAAMTMRFGSVMERHLLPPSMESRQAFEALRSKFPRLSGTPFSVLIEGKDLSEREEEGEIQPFLDALLEDATVVGPVEVERSEDGEMLRYSFLVDGTANEERPRMLLTRVRDTLLSRTVGSLGLSGWTSGNLAYVVDETARYLERTPVVIGVVLLVSMALLLVAFRSIIVPLKALILNLLSTGAAFGIMTILFQSSAIAVWNFGIIEGFVPALLFSILFGLSMDYHILLLARAREEWSAGCDPTTAVERAVRYTFRPITGAALIMTSVFAIVASLELPVMRQLGVGLAAAVILDATLIRAVLLPASMVLLGRWNWYLPGASAR